MATTRAAAASDGARCVARGSNTSGAHPPLAWSHYGYVLCTDTAALSPEAEVSRAPVQLPALPNENANVFYFKGKNGGGEVIATKKSAFGPV